MSSVQISQSHLRIASRPQWIDQEGHDLTPAAARPVNRPFAYERMLRRLPAGIRETLTEHQLDAISDALIPDPPSHAIDYRVSIPLAGRRFYITLLAGRERRSLERLAREAQLKAKHIAMFYSVLLLLLICVSFIGFVLLGYVAKSALDIDLIDGPSMLHQYFFPSQTGMSGMSGGMPGMAGMEGSQAASQLMEQTPRT